MPVQRVGVPYSSPRCLQAQREPPRKVRFRYRATVGLRRRFRGAEYTSFTPTPSPVVEGRSETKALLREGPVHV